MKFNLNEKWDRNKIPWQIPTFFSWGQCMFLHIFSRSNVFVLLIPNKEMTTSLKSMIIITISTHELPHVNTSLQDFTQKCKLYKKITCRIQWWCQDTLTLTALIFCYRLHHLLLTKSQLQRMAFRIFQGGPISNIHCSH